MIDGKQLLADLRKQVGKLEDDIREVCDATPDVDAPLQKEYKAARDAKRTAATFAAWREERITLAAVAWVLGCVFVRFLEDNGLVPEARIAGPGDRLAVARDRETLFFREHPRATGREYLLDVFQIVGRLPGAREVFDERHNPLWKLQPSGDAADALIAVFRLIVPETGALLHDFTDEAWDTRFLGDLYQDLSEPARKRYALLQTPEFVEEFILDRTLTPAVKEFEYAEVRLIDPACGSGHFLLGAFRRLLAQRLEHEPGLTNAGATVAAVLGQVFGVDVNPFAVAIARFRLLVEALRASGVWKLKDAPDFHINIYSGDSLLHGRRPGDTRTTQKSLIGEDSLQHVYSSEDAEALERVLGQSYHAVVGNPPYITPKDAALNEAYRTRFGSCHMKYALAVPFTERFFDLALRGDKAGFVGLITANSFMKREFGKKLIEKFFPRWDLTHVVDTSGAYIPGHGTPTVILLGRNRMPHLDTIRAVMGIRGEPSAPAEPSSGLVWTAIVASIDHPGATGEFVSVSDAARQNFHIHPWSIGGGGAAELKVLIEENAESVLANHVDSIGFGAILGEDDAFSAPSTSPRAREFPRYLQRPIVVGDLVRDWRASAESVALFPYTDEIELVGEDAVAGCLWQQRTVLMSRLDFSKRTYRDCGRPYWEYHQIPKERNRRPLSIAIGEVATHNHFALDRGGKVFNRTAPVIKLPADATEEDHLKLLGLLNCSVGCFWLKQVCFPKGGDHVGSEGARVRKTLWDERYAFDGTKVGKFPIAAERPLALAVKLDGLAGELGSIASISTDRSVGHETPTPEALRAARERAADVQGALLTLQEELDWKCYGYYGLIATDLSSSCSDPPPIEFGQRAFEIVLARNMAHGLCTSTWFERHKSTRTTEIPAHWPDSYRQLVERRIREIEENPNINLIERPEYKRRWNSEPWEVLEERALRSWLLDRLEDPRYWSDIALTTTARLADLARQDADFMQVAEIYRKRSDFDVAALVAELVADEAVPFLPVLRYKDTGLRKRADWEATWELQRAEDRIDARTAMPEGHPDRLTEAAAKLLKATEIGDIPVPPKYASADFRSSVFWRHRGKLDVPKERFVSYPHCSRDADPSLVIAWAGWDHLQLGRALATYHERTKNDDGWTGQRRVPLLAGILELVPWIRQWHNDPDPDTGERMGDYLAGYVDDETRAIGLTPEDLRRWQPPATTARRGRRAKS